MSHIILPLGDIFGGIFLFTFRILLRVYEEKEVADATNNVEGVMAVQIMWGSVELMTLVV
jgi:hypothetical protein